MFETDLGNYFEHLKVKIEIRKLFWKFASAGRDIPSLGPRTEIDSLALDFFSFTSQIKTPTPLAGEWEMGKCAAPAGRFLARCLLAGLFFFPNRAATPTPPPQAVT